MPPNQPQSSQLVYDQCFCNSAFLTPFASNSDTVCLQECTLQADRQLLQAWYNNFCAQVRNGVDPTTQTATSALPTAATSTLTPTTGTVLATATPTTTSTGSTSSTQRHEDQSWIEGHWKWVMMLGILAVGLGLLAWFAVWWKRRHNRKLEAQRAAASGFGHDPEKRPATDPRRSATPDLWGPHQMMEATQGYGYAAQTIDNDFDKRKSKKYRGAESSRMNDPDITEVQEVEKRVLSPRPSNRRARPSELEINARMIGAADRRSKSRGKSRGREGPGDKEIEAGVSDMSIPSLPESRRAGTDFEKT
ncbi:hypothetical protein OHC33_009794 [Knufia fluminis]|uniref:Integral membrane protein n=1 Tax=Knufia fluminis TaxID=191047 RepID=A0AAN8EE11_9EURO|nr:hypothetical protein OHC33_009794 [Knufia fluminis]